MSIKVPIVEISKSDPLGFAHRVLQENVREFRYVFQYANMNLLRKIEKAELTPSDLGSAGGHRGAARARIPIKLLRKKGIKGNGVSLENFVKRRLRL